MSAFGQAKRAQATALEVDWEAAYQELLPKVYHYFCLRTGNTREAEDLTAATFARAWRDRGRFRKDLGAFTNWIFGIARHVLIAQYRQKQQDYVSVDEAKVENPWRPIEEDAAHKDESEQDLIRMAESMEELPLPGSLSHTERDL